MPPINDITNLPKDKVKVKDVRESLSRKRSGLRSYLLCNWKIILFYRTIMPLVPFSAKNVKVTHFGFADPILVGGGGTRSVVVSTAGPGNVYYLPPPSKHTLTLVMFNCSLWSSQDDPLWALSTTDKVLKSEVLRTPWKKITFFLYSKAKQSYFILKFWIENGLWKSCLSWTKLTTAIC